MATSTRQRSRGYDIPEGYRLDDGILVPVSEYEAKRGYKCVNGEYRKKLSTRLVGIPVLGFVFALAWSIFTTVVKPVLIFFGTLFLIGMIFTVYYAIF